MARFITLMGKKQVGKDTSAKMLASIIGKSYVDQSFLDEWNNPSPKVHIVHFADALKEACSIIFGIDRYDMETEEGKSKLTDIWWPSTLMVDDRSEPHLWRATTTEPLPPDRRIPSSTNTEYGRKMTVRELLQFIGTELFRTQLDPDIWIKSVYNKKYGKDDIVIVADCRFPNEANFAKEHGLLIKIERNTGLNHDNHASENALDNYKNYDLLVNNNGSFQDLYAQLKVLIKNGY